MTLFCKDCKHMVYPKGELSLAQCRKGIGERNLVSGEEGALEFCAVMRVDRCGPEGKLFEPENFIPGGAGGNARIQESNQAAAREYSDNLLRIAELEKALQSAIKTLEYCAADPMMLSPINNAQHIAAMNALPDLRAVLAKGKA